MIDALDLHFQLTPFLSTIGFAARIVALGLAGLLVLWLIVGWFYKAMPTTTLRIIASNLALVAGAFVVTYGFCQAADELNGWEIALPWVVAAWMLMTRLLPLWDQAANAYLAREKAAIQANFDPANQTLLVIADTSRPVIMPGTFSYEDQLAAEKLYLVGPIGFREALIFQINCENIGTGKTVVVYVNCADGSTSGTLSMHAALSQVVAHNDVYLIVTGVCGTAGLTVAMAIPANHRFGTVQAEFGIGYVSGSSEYGRLLSQHNHVVKPLTEGARVDPDSLRSHLRSGKNYWFDVDRAIELGIVTGITNAALASTSKEVVPSTEA